MQTGTGRRSVRSPEMQRAYDREIRRLRRLRPRKANHPSRHLAKQDRRKQQERQILRAFLATSGLFPKRYIKGVDKGKPLESPDFLLFDLSCPPSRRVAIELEQYHQGGASPCGNLGRAFEANWRRMRLEIREALEAHPRRDLLLDLDASIDFRQDGQRRRNSVDLPKGRTRRELIAQLLGYICAHRRKLLCISETPYNWCGHFPTIPF